MHYRMTNRRNGTMVHCCSRIYETAGMSRRIPFYVKAGGLKACFLWWRPDSFELLESVRQPLRWPRYSVFINEIVYCSVSTWLLSCVRSPGLHSLPSFYWFESFTMFSDRSSTGYKLRSYSIRYCSLSTRLQLGLFSHRLHCHQLTVHPGEREIIHVFLLHYSS
jgi:hypothetical protein